MEMPAFPPRLRVPTARCLRVACPRKECPSKECPRVLAGTAAVTALRLLAVGAETLPPHSAATVSPATSSNGFIAIEECELEC
jgi:hypothetical protein